MQECSRAQSDVIGVALLTGVVVIAVGVAGGIFLASSGDEASSENPLLDVDVTLTDSTIRVAHAGGDSIAITDLAVVVDGDTERNRYDLDPANVTGNGDGLFEPGEVWKRDHASSDRTATVLVVHEPSNVVIAEEFVDART